MTVWVLTSLTLLGLWMKLVALLVSQRGWANKAFLLSPLLSPNGLRRSRSVTETPRVLRQAGTLLGAFVVWYWLLWFAVRAVHLRGLLLSHLAVALIFLFSEALISVAALLWLPSGRLLPSLHNKPWQARGVADFWAHRWNLWFTDWFRYVLFIPLRRRPVLALFVVFAVSGLMHEATINVPLYRLTGRNLIGSMMIYFLVQALGILVERRFLRTAPRARILFAWIVVFLPSPLVINEGILRTLHLWPG